MKLKLVTFWEDWPSYEERDLGEGGKAKTRRFRGSEDLLLLSFVCFDGNIIYRLLIRLPIFLSAKNTKLEDIWEVRQKSLLETPIKGV